MSKLPAPANKISVDVKDGMNDDIIDVLEKNFPVAVKEAAPAARFFKGRTRLDTARNIWMWLKNDIRYAKDPEGVQDIRMPRYFHYHKKGDCKSFTLNALALWANIYPEDKVRFFYAGYNGGTKVPTHVYAKIQPSDGSKEIIIDGCWHFVNSEKSYTFGKYSPNMQVRTLSDNTGAPEQYPGPYKMSPLIRNAYQRMSPTERARMDSCMNDMAKLEILKREQVEGYDISEDLEGIAAKHKGGKKDGHKNKKAMHIFNALNPVMLLGRSCFLLAVSLNLNGLASKLGKLNEWKKDGDLMNFWYISGGAPKKFEKIIQHSAKKKKLFLSKKAKKKYEARYGPLSPNEVAYEKGVHSVDGIGFAPAIAAAVIGMIPILAGIIPKMAKAFHSSIPQHPEAAREASGLISEGQDLADAVQKNGYPLSVSDVESVMGHEPIGPDGKPIHIPQNKLFKFGNTQFHFDWHNLHVISGMGDPTPDFGPQPDPDNTPAPADTSTPSVPDNSASTAQFNNTMATLGPILQTVTTAGLATASSVMSQSNNPNVRKWGGALGAADSALAGRNLQAAGYPDLAKLHDKIHKGTDINLFPIVLGAGVLFGVYELAKPKQQAVSGIVSTVKEHPWLTGGAVALAAFGIPEIILRSKQQAA